MGSVTPMDSNGFMITTMVAFEKSGSHPPQGSNSDSGRMIARELTTTDPIVGRHPSTRPGCLALVVSVECTENCSVADTITYEVRRYDTDEALRSIVRRLNHKGWRITFPNRQFLCPGHSEAAASLATKRIQRLHS